MYAVDQRRHPSQMNRAANERYMMKKHATPKEAPPPAVRRHANLICLSNSSGWCVALHRQRSERTCLLSLDRCEADRGAPRGENPQRVAVLSPKLVRAVRRGAKIQEKILFSSLTDAEAYRIEGQMIGTFHKNHSGQLWNTIDERFMDPQYLPKTWSNPVHPAYKVPRPLVSRDGPLFAGQVSIERQREISQKHRTQRLSTL